MPPTIWEMVGGWGAGGHQNSDGSGSFSGGGHMAGGARPQTAEIIKAFNQRCPEYTITNNRDRADFAVTLDHEGSKRLVRHLTKSFSIARAIPFSQTLPGSWVTPSKPRARQ